MDPARISSLNRRAAGLRPCAPTAPGEGGAQGETFDNSPRLLAQRQQLQSAFGSALQRASSDEEEPLQGPFVPVQRAALACARAFRRGTTRGSVAGNALGPRRHGRLRSP